MNEFLSSCRHLLVSFRFHDLTSLLHFMEMIFPLVPLIFHFREKPQQKGALRRAECRLCVCALAHTDTTRARPSISCDHTENGVVHCSSVKNRTVYPEDVQPWRVTIARHLCTPPLPLEAFSENISASTGSSKEIAGLKKKRNMMTRKS